MTIDLIVNGIENSTHISTESHITKSGTVGNTIDGYS